MTVSASAAITWAVYLIAAASFVLGLHMMRSPATARRGNLLSAAGMTAAVLITLILFIDSGNIGWHGGVGAVVAVIAGLIVGGGYGLVSARRVQMTAMPQLVSLFNAVGGGAAVFVALADYLEKSKIARSLTGTSLSGEFTVPVVLDVIIGCVTFTGSIIAAGKLLGKISGNPITFPGSRIALMVSAVVSLGSAIGVVAMGGSGWLLILALVGALVFGVLMVLPIGGADMPVVISLLNAFTGLAVAMAGFVLESDVMIIAGALVGASGSILTKQMADAMNRSIMSIMVGGFGGESAAVMAGPEGSGTVRTVDADDVAIQLAYASKVIFVPGYGLAAAQAQHEIAELGDLLTKNGITVYYAIHPVAGRMPGHMNVLLAEANVSYDQMKEMDDVNPEFETADVALVVGANDVTNPAARRPGTAISGMPILDVDHAKSIVVIKRSMASGYAGIDNELYVNPKTGMFFSDAKKGLADLTAAVKEYLS